MNKDLYKINRTIQRRYSRHPILYYDDMTKIMLNATMMNNIMIISRIYNEVNKPCQRYNEDTKKWEKGIIKKNKESKEEFELNKALAIVDSWINFMYGIVELYTGKKIKYKNTKDILIESIINCLNQIKEKKDVNSKK